jgi:DNA-binding transcriptional LysR family regulator
MSPAQFRECVLIFVPDARVESGETLEQALWRNGVDAKLSYRLDSFEGVLQFAAHGIGIGILPKWLIEREGGLKLVPVPVMGLGRIGYHTIGWIQHAKSADSVRLKSLKQALLNDVK